MKLIQASRVRQYLLLLVACLVVSVTGCVTQTSKDGVTSDATERECRTTATIGSKMRRSLCLTKEDWAAIDAKEAEIAADKERDSDEFFRRSYQRSGLTTGDAMDNPNSP